MKTIPLALSLLTITLLLASCDLRRRNEPPTISRVACRFCQQQQIVENGVIINGIRWATRNVDMPGTFTKNPEDAGMFYQWNHCLGWSNTEPFINSDGNSDWGCWVSGWEYFDDTFIWSRATDPCPPGWRVPTAGEFYSLLLTTIGVSVADWDCEDFLDFWYNYDFSSHWTNNWQSTGVSGMILGRSPNQIFLPAVGSSDCYLLKGNYWSSSGRNLSVAARLTFQEESAFVWDRSPTDSAISVRCVAEN